MEKKNEIKGLAEGSVVAARAHSGHSSITNKIKLYAKWTVFKG